MAPAEAPTESGGAPGKRPVLFAISLGVFMATLDASIVNLALPGMAHEFVVDPPAVAPVVGAYLAAVAASLLLFGAIGDRTGRRRLYLIGLAVFTAGSALCALSWWSLDALIAFRVVQGLGGAMMFSLGPAILLEVFPPSQRGAALGWIASAVAAGQTAGPVVGGVLLGLFGWPAIFLVNIPIGVGAYFATARILRGTKQSVRFRKDDGSLHAFDSRGALLLPAGLVCLVGALQVGTEVGLLAPLTLVLLAASFACFAVLRNAERRAEAPLIDLAVFHNREFVAANASAVISFVAIGSVSFVLPFYLKGVLGYEAYRMGLMLLPIPLAIAAIGPFAGRISDRIGSRLPCAIGLSLAALSVLTLSTLTGTATEFDLIWRFGAFGAGMALFQSPNNSSAMGSVPRPLLGLASGTLSTMRSLGLAVGVASGAILLSAFYAAQTGGVPLPTGDIAPDGAAFVGAQQLTFLTIAVVTAAGVVTSLVRGARAREPAPAPTASSRGK
jgi:EmrB/QacA subfamily drug resistance transporter